MFGLFSLNLFAQREQPKNLPKIDQQAAHFGYSLGLNMIDFAIRPSDRFLTSSVGDTVFAVEVGRFVGFNVNVIANLRLAEYLDIRFTPGLIFGQRALEYKYAKGSEFRRHTMMLESTFLDLPISLKYRAERINNWRPFLLTGISTRVDLAAQKKINPQDMPKIRLKPFDAYYEIGLGLDFFLEYFMFGVELKASWGMFNIVEYDNTQYTDCFKRLNSRMLHLSFCFEGGKADPLIRKK